MAKKFVLVFEHAFEGVFCIGPFDSVEHAEQYAQDHHDLSEVWRHAELREPEPDPGRPETA